MARIMRWHGNKSASPVMKGVSGCVNSLHGTRRSIPKPCGISMRSLTHCGSNGSMASIFAIRPFGTWVIPNGTLLISKTFYLSAIRFYLIVEVTSQKHNLNLILGLQVTTRVRRRRTSTTGLRVKRNSGTRRSGVHTFPRNSLLPCGLRFKEG